jgi:hypothetical protein
MSTDGYGFEKNVEDMLVAELKEALAARSLSTIGKKLELVSRLKDHLNEEQQPGLKRKANEVTDEEETDESNKKQKTESDHEEIQTEGGEDNNDGEVEYQEVGVEGEYQANQEYQEEHEQEQHENVEGQEQIEGDEEVEVEEVGAGRELYPEEKEEQEEKERNEESQSQDGNDSKDSLPGQNKIPTLAINEPNQFIRQPSLRDQVKVALDDKNIEELDKLTKVLLSQNEQSKIKLMRLQRTVEDYARTMQAQAANFNREKFMFTQIARERDELRMRLGARPAPTAPMARPPPLKSAMPPQQPLRAMPPTGQRYGQVPPLPRPPTTGYAQQTPMIAQQQAYARPGYASGYQQQQPTHQQYQNHQQSQPYPQSYQQRKY